MREFLLFSTLLTSLVLSPLTANGATTTSTTTHHMVLQLRGTVTPGTNNVTGTFRASQLGSGHFSETSTLLTTTIPSVYGTHAVFTATNGDTIVTDGALVSLPPTTPHCHGASLAGGAVITGGTGRFANATGQLQTTGCIDETVSPPVVTAFSFGSIGF